MLKSKPSDLPALDRAAVLASRKPLPPVPVDCPELAGKVYVRRLTVGQIDQYQEAIRKCDPSLVRGTILSFALCDQAGAPLFTSEDIPALCELGGQGFEPVIDQFLAINGQKTGKN